MGRVRSGLGAFVVAMLAGSCGGPHQPGRTVTGQEIALAAHFLEWPRQLNNDLLVYTITAAQSTALVCVQRADHLREERKAGQNAARRGRLATAIAGLTATALTASGTLFEEDSDKARYTTIVGLSTGALTSLIGALSDYWNGDGRMQESSRKLGEIEEATSSLVASWQAALRKFNVEHRARPDGGVGNQCLHVVPSALPTTRDVWVAEASSPTLGRVEWKRINAAKFFGSLRQERCLLPREKQLELTHELVAAVERLRHACSDPEAEIRSLDVDIDPAPDAGVADSRDGSTASFRDDY